MLMVGTHDEEQLSALGALRGQDNNTLAHLLNLVKEGESGQGSQM